MQTGNHGQRASYTASDRLEKLGNALHEFVSFGQDMGALRLDQSSGRNIPSSDGNNPVPNGATPFSSSTYIDSLGRPLVETGNHGQRASYTYDNNGNPTAITDAAGRTTTRTYDAQDRLLTITNYAGEVTEMHYDSAGNLEWVRDPRFLVTSYTYNGFGQGTAGGGRSR